MNLADVDVKVLRLQPGDVIVLRSPEELTDEQAKNVIDRATEVFPRSNRVIVLERLAIDVVRPDALSTAEDGKLW